MAIRELSIVYGSLTINEANARYIDGNYRIDKKLESTTVTFSFIIRKATEATFAAEVVAVEDAFRIPFKNLTITQGSATLLTLSHTSNTGMNAHPTITKEEHPANTGRSRRYTVSIVFDMPADNTSSILTDGMRQSSIDVRYTPSGRRTVTISGIFTALSTIAARAQYEAKITAYAAAALSALGGTYELADRPKTETDGTNKLISFTHIYEELIYPQSAGAVDDPELARQQFSMNLVKNYPGDEPNDDINRLVTVQVNYDVSVATTVTNLKTKWNTIKAWIMSKVKAAYTLTSVALVDENTIFNNDENKITSSLTIRALLKSGNLLEEQITYRWDTVSGTVLIPVWTGDPLAKYVYQGPQTLKLTVTVVAKLLGEDGTIAFNDIQKKANVLIGGGKSILVSHTKEHKPLIIGQSPHTHKITEFTSTSIFELYNTPRVGSTQSQLLGGGNAGGGKDNKAGSLPKPTGLTGTNVTGPIDPFRFATSPTKIILK